MISIQTIFFQILPTLIVAYIAWKIVKFIQAYRTWNKAYEQATILGPRKPITGHIYLFRDSEEMLKLFSSRITETRGKVFSAFLLCFPYFCLNHPDTIKILIKSSEPKPKGFGEPYEAFIPWLGDGLVLSDGPQWERNRRLLTPAFHFDILMPYIKIYNEVVDILLDKMWQAGQFGDSVEIYQPVGLATLDTMLRCAFSYEGNVQTVGDHPYANAVKRLTYLAYERAIHPGKWISWVYFNLLSEGRECKKLLDYVHKFADDVIKARKESLKSDPSQLNKRRLDFLDILLTAKDEDGEGLTDKDIRSEVDTFLFAGHDTTASAISWAIYALAKYPEEQKKVAEEVLEITGSEGSVNGEELPKLRYLHMFIREVMRMYCPVPLISRKLTKTTVFDKVEIPAGLYVDINIYGLHHNPDVYPDHEEFRPEIFNEENSRNRDPYVQEFRPERFNEENSRNRDPYAFVPFSAGPRNCIGQNFAMHEIKVFISRLVKRFAIDVDPEHKIAFLPDSVMRAKHGIMIKFKER